MILVSSCSCLCPIHWSQVLSQEWRCSWSSADRWRSNYIWVINKFIGVAYIRGLAGPAASGSINAFVCLSVHLSVTLLGPISPRVFTQIVLNLQKTHSPRGMKQHTCITFSRNTCQISRSHRPKNLVKQIKFVFFWEFSEECAREMAWNLTCWCLLTTFTTDKILVMVCSFSSFWLVALPNTIENGSDYCIMRSIHCGLVMPSGNIHLGQHWLW